MHVYQYIKGKSRFMYCDDSNYATYIGPNIVLIKNLDIWKSEGKSKDRTIAEIVVYRSYNDTMTKVR